jgi:hypothetical protein
VKVLLNQSKHGLDIVLTLGSTSVRPFNGALDVRFRRCDPEHVKHHLKVPSIPRQESAVTVLEHDVSLIGSKGKLRCRALFDSGATYSIIRRDIAERIEPLVLLPDPEDWIFETALAGQLIQARYRVTLNFRFDDSKARFSDEFIVFDTCTEEVIVGAKTMQAWHITLDFETETINYRKTAERLRVI